MKTPIDWDSILLNIFKNPSPIVSMDFQVDSKDNTLNEEKIVDGEKNHKEEDLKKGTTDFTIDLSNKNYFSFYDLYKKKSLNPIEDLKAIFDKTEYNLEDKLDTGKKKNEHLKNYITASRSIKIVVKTAVDKTGRLLMFKTVGMSNIVSVQYSSNVTIVEDKEEKTEDDKKFNEDKKKFWADSENEKLKNLIEGYKKDKKYIKDFYITEEFKSLFSNCLGSFGRDDSEKMKAFGYVYPDKNKFGIFGKGLFWIFIGGCGLMYVGDIHKSSGWRLWDDDKI